MVLPTLAAVDRSARPMLVQKTLLRMWVPPLHSA